MSGQTKIRHAYIIYVDRPESIEYANQCAASCEANGLPYTLFRGVQQFDKAFLEQTTGIRWDYNSNSGDCGCTASHILLWQMIAKQEHACCIFEHDIIVKHNFCDFEIPDKSLVMLGYRVLQESDYDYPNIDVDLKPVTKFEGTHAYAITPNMANELLNRLQVHGAVTTTIDGIISIGNQLNVDRQIIDPPPVVCVVGNRTSTIQGTPAAYNGPLTPGFIGGLKVEPLRIIQ